MRCVDCNICGSRKSSVLFSTSDFRTEYKEVFNLVRCNVCGLVYINPQPTKDEIAKFYPHDYFFRLSRPEEDKLVKRYQAEKIRMIKSFKVSGRILDIGCGVGTFLATARGEGYDCYGVEISDIASDYAKDSLGLYVTPGELCDVDFPNEYFDIITLWHVLEHVFDPKHTLEIARRLLKSDGLLVIAVPNFASFEAKIFKDKWFHLEVPRHLYHFSPVTLRELLDKVGFEPLWCTSFSKEHNYQGLSYSFTNYFHRHKRNKRIAFKDEQSCKSTDSLKRFVKGVIGMLLRGINLILSLLRVSGTFEVYCRKR